MIGLRIRQESRSLETVNPPEGSRRPQTGCGREYLILETPIGIHGSKHSISQHPKDRVACVPKKDFFISQLLKHRNL